ncbi:MAG: hypothetical protein HPZ91_11880 [Lentisphaeria bacterium]|nr:hypothetical protein [Lentisphaeria bacterium]
MKRSLLFGIAAVAAVQLSAEVAVAPSGWKIGRDAADPVVTEESFSATATGSDTILSIIGFQPFASAENDLLTFSVRFPAGKTTNLQLFWANDKDRALSEKKSTGVRINGTGELETYTLLLAGRPGWEGTITSLRLDPVAIPKGTREEFAVGTFRLSDSGSGMAVPATRWAGAVNCKIAGRSGDVLTGEFIGRQDPNISAQLPGKIDADKLKTISFDLSLPAGSTPAGQLFWKTGEMKTYTEKHSMHYKIPADGEFHTVTLNLGGKAEWAGKITDLRLDMTHRPPADGTGTFRLKNFIVK